MKNKMNSAKWVQWASHVTQGRIAKAIVSLGDSKVVELALKRIRSMRRDYLLKFVCLVMTDLLPTDALRPWDPKWAGDAKSNPEPVDDPMLRCRMCNKDNDSPPHFWSCPKLLAERSERLSSCLSKADVWAVELGVTRQGRRGISNLIELALVPDSI